MRGGRSSFERGRIHGVGAHLLWRRGAPFERVTLALEKRVHLCMREFKLEERRTKRVRAHKLKGKGHTR